MENKRKYILLIGRWQILSRHHMNIINSFIDRDIPVCLGVLDKTVDDDNPLSAVAVSTIMKTLFIDNTDIKVIIIPDFENMVLMDGDQVEMEYADDKMNVSIEIKDIIKMINDNNDEWKKWIPHFAQDVTERIIRNLSFKDKIKKS